MATLMTMAAAIGTGVGATGAGGGLGTLLSLGSAAIGGVAQIQAGNQAAAAGRFAAEQQRSQAQQERASAEREGAEERRQGRLLQSKARAAGAASGGGMDVNALGDIASESERRALTAIWGGEERARGLETGAQVSVLEGEQRRKASRIEGFGTMLSSGASWYSNYAPRSGGLT